MTSTRHSSIPQIFRACFLVLVLAGFASAIPLRAQDQPASAEPKPAADSAQHPRGPAQEVVHESKEAAGEEKDETAQFKQSTAVRLIAKWTGRSLQEAYWLCVILNFLVIAAIIGWVARKSLPGMFRDRTAAIQKAMQ